MRINLFVVFVTGGGVAGISRKAVTSFVTGGCDVSKVNGCCFCIWLDELLVVFQ